MEKRKEGRGQDTDRTHHSKKDADDYDKMRTACTSQEKKRKHSKNIEKREIVTRKTKQKSNLV